VRLLITETVAPSVRVELSPWLMSILVAVVVIGVALVAIIVLVCYYRRRMKAITRTTLPLVTHKPFLLINTISKHISYRQPLTLPPSGPLNCAPILLTLALYKSHNYLLNDLAQLMPLPLAISCSSKSRLVLLFWFYLSGTGCNCAVV